MDFLVLRSKYLVCPSLHLVLQVPISECSFEKDIKNLDAHHPIIIIIITGIAILLADFMCHSLVLPGQKAGDVCPFPADSKDATMKNVVCADSSDFHAVCGADVAGQCARRSYTHWLHF